MEPRLKIQPAAFCRPKYESSFPGGEDAYFIDMAAQVIGIADGVGGWSKKGIDAGEYARQLMKNAAKAVNGRPPNQINPMEVLVKAHRATVADGSSTACVISFDGRLLRFANLGDSGFLVLRRKTVVYKSRPQQHKFNHPFQIGKRRGTDTPDAAEVGNMVLIEGDVIVAGTDGLWDNLSVEEINNMMGYCYLNQPEEMANRLGLRAFSISRNENCGSPFQRDAMKAGVRHSGGKRDDITVVVAYVVRDVVGNRQVFSFGGCENIARFVFDEDGDTVMVDAF